MAFRRKFLLFCIATTITIAVRELDQDDVQQNDFEIHLKRLDQQHFAQSQIIPRVRILGDISFSSMLLKKLNAPSQKFQQPALISKDGSLKNISEHCNDPLDALHVSALTWPFAEVPETAEEVANNDRLLNIISFNGYWMTTKSAQQTWNGDAAGQTATHNGLMRNFTDELCAIEPKTKQIKYDKGNVTLRQRTNHATPVSTSELPSTKIVARSIQNEDNHDGHQQMEQPQPSALTTDANGKITYSPIISSMLESLEVDECTPRDFLQDFDCQGTNCVCNVTTVSGNEITVYENNFTKDRCECKLTVASVCIIFAFMTSSDVRQKLLPLIGALFCPMTMAAVITEGKQMINASDETNQKQMEIIKRWKLVFQPILRGVKTDYFNHQASLSALFRPRKSAVPGFDLEKDTNGKNATKKKSKCGTCVNNSSQSRCGGNHTSSQPREYTVYPAAFLPSAGSSPTEAMSFLGYRLASLNSLPASCNVSRIRLAEAGFYYDNSKTSRNATNVHELACFSCGVAYAGWKNGDNPTAVHRQIKPDCPHVQTLPATPATTTTLVYNATAPSANTSLGGGVSGTSWSSGPTSADSGYSSGSMQQSSIPEPGYSSGSMQQSSIPESSFESTSSRLENGSSARQSPHANHAQPSIGPQSVDVPDSGMYSDSGRSYASDLATDAAGIAPPPLTNDARLAPSQAGRFAPARDSIYTNQSFARDTSGARVQDFEDRPPLVMSQAVYPQFSRQQERRSTFTNWPLNHCFHPDDLVMQGFYYAGYADCIRCFYCGVGLKSWDERDDVMKEHIRWRPSCGYILNTKGRQFVGQIQQELRTANATSIQNSNNNREETTTATTTAAPRPVSPPRHVNTVMSATTATAQMDLARPNASTTTGPATTAPSSSATSNASAESHAPSSSSSSSAGGGNAGNTSREVLRKVEEMGFSKNSIARAVRHLQQIGQSKVTADGLVETILNIVEDDNYQTDSAPATEGASASADEVPDRAQRIMAENQRLRTRQICRMCNNARVGMIFLPCGHVLACTTCGSTTRSCPNCGEFIRATANIYLS